MRMSPTYASYFNPFNTGHPIQTNQCLKFKVSKLPKVATIQFYFPDNSKYFKLKTL